MSDDGDGADKRRHQRHSVLFSGLLQPGQTFAVPPTATAPVLKTGKPEALKITVGASVAPPIGPAATTVHDVSLLPADLMRAGQGPAAASPSGAAPSPAATPREERPRTAGPAPTAPAPPPPAAAPPTNTVAGE